MLERLPGLLVQPGSAIERIPAALRELLALPPDERAALAAPAAPAASRPLVSVIVPTFNGAHFLPEAVASILRQNHPALDIIVVDDHSTDDTAAAVAALPVDVRCFRQDSNLGPAAARNRGIKDAAADFIAFLDVDDLWPEGNLSTMLDAMLADPAIDVMLGMGQLVREHPQTGELVYTGNPEESFQYYIGSALYRREVFQRIGLFDESLRFGEDHDWFNRAREAGLRIERTHQISLLVRRHNGNMTRGKSLVELNQLRVLKKMLDRRRAAQAVGGGGA